MGKVPSKTKLQGLSSSGFHSLCQKSSLLQFQVWKLPLTNSQLLAKNRLVLVITLRNMANPGGRTNQHTEMVLNPILEAFLSKVSPNQV